jgi:hypothetical protein
VIPTRTEGLDYALGARLGIGCPDWLTVGVVDAGNAGHGGETPILHDSRSRVGRSRRSGRPQTFGWTSTGKYITVIWEEVSDNPLMIYPVTAYEVPPLEGRQK